MKDLRSFIGPSSTRRRIATLVAVVGIVFVGTLLARAWPRDQDVIYELAQGATELEVDYLQENEAVTSVRFRALNDETLVIQDRARLQPGNYQARITVYGPGDSVTEEVRTLVVPTEGVVRFNLSQAGTRSE